MTDNETSEPASPAAPAPTPAQPHGTQRDDRRSDIWPERGLVLAGLGAVIGWICWLLLDPERRANAPIPDWHYSVSAFLVIAGLAFGLTWERTRMALAAGFAALCGLVIASVVHWNILPQGKDFDEPWRLACAALACCIAVPLFTAWRAKGGGGLRGLDYATVHDRAWTAALTGAAAFVFTLIAWAMLWLLASLFDLIGIHAVRDLLAHSWFDVPFLAGAYAAAIGLLRDRDAMIGTLQRIVMTVLSVLAPLLGTGLVIFLLSLPFTGLAPLWQATKHTTPILLWSVIVGFFLVNAALGDSARDEARNPIIRWGAMALGAAMLPLALIAAVSTGKRIAEYGLTPDRLWAVVFTAIASAFGLAYAAALIRRRQQWAGDVRPANLNLAIGVGAIALLLSTPLISFGALSTHSQVARLTSGKVTPDRFDWAALRFDFGAPGRAALERLTKSGTPAIRERAVAALKETNRYQLNNAEETAKAADTLDTKLIVMPAGTPIPPGLRTLIAQNGGCHTDLACRLIFDADGRAAYTVDQNCPDCQIEVVRYAVKDKDWAMVNGWEDNLSFLGKTPAELAARRVALTKALKAGQVEVRTVTRRQVFVGGQPVGSAY